MRVMGYGLWVMGLIVWLSLPHMGCAAENNIQKAETSVEAVKDQKKQEDPYLWDFGKVKAGDIVKHDFILKNDTQKTWSIKNVQTSCGCTASKIKKDILAPGESTVIDVQFNSKKYSGPVQQFIYVNTDDIDNQIIRYIIKADVEALGTQEHKSQEHKK